MRFAHAVQSLSAIASQPLCKWPRHEYRSVLTSQAGCMDAVKYISLCLSLGSAARIQGL